MKTILCYGDSNTYGYIPGGNGARCPREVRWTTLLQNRLGDRAEVIVEGLNGRTTVFDRVEAPWKNGLPYLLPCLRSHEPLDMIVFMLGTNDCSREVNVTAERVAEGMETLLSVTEEETRERQGFVPATVLIVPGAIREVSEGHAHEKNDADAVQKSHEIAPLYRKLAEAHGCLFLDGTDTFEISDIDGEHLTEKGHRQLADALYELINDKI